MTDSTIHEDLPAFLREHADRHPDPTAVRGIVTWYEDTLELLLEHPYAGGPVQRDETPVLGGPPTFQRISGRLDGLLVAMKYVAAALESQPGYQDEWRISDPQR